MLQLRNTEFVEKQLILIEKMKGPNFIDAKNTLLLYKYLLSMKLNFNWKKKKNKNSNFDKNVRKRNVIWP